MWALLLAADITGAGMLPGPSAPVTSSALSVCSSASVPAPGVVSPAGDASVTGLSGRQELAWESPHSEQHSRR